MCAPHWFRLKDKFPALARAVELNYREGQEIRKDPTRAYLDAAARARNALWLDEILYGYVYERGTR